MFPARRYPHILCLTANEKDFSLSLEMTIWGKRHPHIVVFPIGKGGPRQRRSGTLVYCLLETIFPALIQLEPYPAPSARHLPHAGKASSVDIVFSTYAYIRSDNARKAAFSYRSLVFPSVGAKMYPYSLSISPRNPRA